MKNQFFVLVLLVLLISGCNCDRTYEGYGRYKLSVDCETVVIDGVEYQLTIINNQLAIDRHTLSRGVDRKQRPWLYLHDIDRDNNKVDVTFEQGGKSLYPLYTGSSASIFDVYSKPYELKESTCALFDNNYWLVSHRFTQNGIYFDLNENLNPATDREWRLHEGNILVSSDGTPTSIPLINTKVTLTSFDYGTKTATAVFEEIN